MNGKSPAKRGVISMIIFALLISLPFPAITLSPVKSVYTNPPLSLSAPNASANASEPPLTVVIDAGHGGEDGGASGGGVVEKDLNLDIAFSLCDLLTLSGIPVIMTRTEDKLLYDRNADYMGHKKSLDQAARLKIAKSAGNAVFVSIHMNAFPQEKYCGLQVYYSGNYEGSATLASYIQDNAKNYIKYENNRKTKNAKDSIYLLDRLDIAAVLVECGFLSNVREAALLADSEYRKELALILYFSVCQYIYSCRS